MQRAVLTSITLGLVACGPVGFDDLYGLEEAVGPRVLVDPEGEVLFPQAPAGGSTVEQVVLIQSIGDERAFVEDIYIMGDDAESFALGDMGLPWQLDPEAERPLYIEFAADAVGQFSAVLVLETQGEGTVSVSRRLVGTGCLDHDQDDVCDPEGPPGADDTGL